MERPKQPSDIAREAIGRLAARRLPPTPENFARVYAEVTGKEEAAKGKPPADWPAAIRGVMRAWEGYQSGLTQPRKREMLDRVLINFAAEPDVLCEKLTNLARNWGDGAASAGVEVASGVELAVPERQAAPVEGPAVMPSDLCQALADSLRMLGSGLMDDWPDLAGRASALADSLAGGAGESLVPGVTALWREILVRAEDDQELLRGMQRMLGALFRNMGTLAEEDAWLQGQIATVGALLDGQLDYHTLAEAERGLQEVISRQERLRDSMKEAKQKLKQLIATFIDRVGDISSSTGLYQERIQGYSERIAQAEDISELGAVIDGLTTDMSAMREAMQQSHADLIQARSHVEEADRRIHELEKELEEVSALVRVDQLTGALNRRGLDEAFARETARAERLSAPLSVALMDIDHFKRLNDTYGHQAGDDALVHLSRVVRKLLRPTDALARYGGEEFLILLPNTELAEADKVLQRVQRGLTKEFFLYANQRVLITFSAGVTQHLAGEARDVLVARADAAMYRAKTQGRNRVECAA